MHRSTLRWHSSGRGSLEIKQIARDPLLRGMLAVPLIVGLAARLVLPMVLGRISASLDTDLLGYYPLIVNSALLTIGPVICGVVVGFMLLDQRDDRTLLALRVTPVSLRRYLANRLAWPMLLGLLVTPLAMALSGQVQLRLPGMLATVVTALPLAPVTALALAVFARNKVQGFALAKGASVLMIAPLLALWVPMPWQMGFGLLPTYWPIWLYRALVTGEPYGWVYGGVALALDALILAALLRRFERLG